MTAPDRIWAWPWDPSPSRGQWKIADNRDCLDTEFVRADLHAALQAENERFRKEIESWIASSRSNIKRIQAETAQDCILCCRVAPSDEWSEDYKSGYDLAARECRLNIENHFDLAHSCSSLK